MNHKEFSTSFIVLQGDQEGMLHCRGTMSPKGFCILCPKEVDTTDRLKILVRLPGPGIWVQVWGTVRQRIEGDYTARLSGVITDSAELDIGKLTRWTLSAHQAA